MKHNQPPPCPARALTSRVIRYSMAYCSVGVILLVLAGCASKEGSRAAAKPGDGIAEYRQIASKAERAVRSALNALHTISSTTNASDTLPAFSAEVNRLQVDSVEVRARSQAIQERGDAYFAHWQENMARVEDPRLRARADACRPQFEASFRRIKSLSQEAREAFQPFLSELRQIRNAAENSPAAISNTGTQDLMRDAGKHGTRVAESIASIIRELDSMQAALTPPAKGKKGQVL